VDHDQRFKTLLREFFPDFMRLFFADWAERFDFSQIEWLDKEVFPDPPQGERRVLDLVAKLPTRQAVPGQRTGETERWLALVHAEIESEDSVQPLRSRVHDYYEHLRHLYKLPVLPIALYLRVGLEGIGIDEFVEYFWEFEVQRFRYLYVGLPGLKAENYLSGDSWLGVALAALMHIPDARRAWVKAEALRRLVTCPENEWRRFLLCECVQAYLPLEEPQQREFDQLLVSEAYKEILPMTTTWFEQGLEQGRQQGLEQGRQQGLEQGQQQGLEQGQQQGLEQGQQQGERKMLRLILEGRYGPLSPRALERLESWPADRLAELGSALLLSQTLSELGLEE
jgi:hypothetical protein